MQTPPPDSVLKQLKQQYDLSLEDMAELQDHRNVLFIFDSFDEAWVDGPSMQRNLLALNSLGLWKKSKTIITCREDFIQKHEKQVVGWHVLLQQCLHLVMWPDHGLVVKQRASIHTNAPHFRSYLACQWKVHLPP